MRRRTNTAPTSRETPARRSHQRLVRQFGAVWVASQGGMAAIGATRKDALAGLADCIKCKTSLHRFMNYKLRYYLGKLCKFLGFCRDCRATLLFTKYGRGICPRCSKRY